MKFKKAFIFFFYLMLLTGCSSRPQRTYIDDMYNSARNAYSREQYDQARLSYKKLVIENPGNAFEDVSLYYWGESARKAGKFKEAEEVFNNLINKYKSGFWVDLARKNLSEMDYSKY